MDNKLKKLIKLSRSFGRFDDLSSWENHKAFYNSEWSDLYTMQEYREWRLAIDQKISELKSQEKQRKVKAL
jgi:hypothetical protein